MTFYASTTRTTDDDHNTDERNTSLLQHQCDQNFLLRITEDSGVATLGHWPHHRPLWPHHQYLDMSRVQCTQPYLMS